MKRLNPLDSALRFLRRGYSVIPVGQDKKPLIPWTEYTKRHPTTKEVRSWFEKFKDPNIGIVTGKISNITVVDVEQGGEYEYLPVTKTVNTGGGGKHLYYKYTDKLKNSVRIRHLTDIRNDGGYVIAPPSLHASGKRYLFVKNTLGKPLEPFPIHLFMAETIKKQEKTDLDELMQGVEKGRRNDTAAKICGHFLTKMQPKLWEKFGWEGLKSWNKNLDEPLPESELRSVFDSIASRVTFAEKDTEKEIYDSSQLTEQHQTVMKEREDGVIRAVSSGFKMLDGCLNGGWKSGELAIIGARPSVGKSSLALTFAINAAKSGASVLFFSIEMTAIDLYDRMISMVSKIPCNDIISGDCDKKKLNEAYKKVKEMKIQIAELTRASSKEVTDIVKTVLLEKQIDLIIVDYLQFLNDGNKNGNDAQRVSKISKNLKMLARMTGIPVISPAQLNRKIEERGSRMPRMSDLKDSGSIEQDADIIILMHRRHDSDTKNEATLFLTKNRKGQTGKIDALFDIQTTMFSEK